MRGTVDGPYANVLEVRITPACAGNRPLKSSGHFAWRDHPRVCGEQIWQRKWPGFVQGSPPRVRGTDLHIGKACSSVRITPACAGNSQSGKLDLFEDGDHPRVCGEQQDRGMGQTGTQGSPPRVRGTAGAARKYEKKSRITPACAGNSG